VFSVWLKIQGAQMLHAGSFEDKLRALKQYRRARSLCDRYDEKWSHGHKCATTVQLHYSGAL
jgi:hypothetical protein